MPDQRLINPAAACSVATDSNIIVEAGAVAPLLGLSPDLFITNVRRGMIAQLTERGVDEDAGLYRVTFRYRSRCCRVVVNPQADTVTPV